LAHAELPYEIFYYVPFHISQAKVAAAITVGEPLVVEAEQVQAGCVEVMHVDPLLDHLEAKIVCRALNAGLYSATREQRGIPVMIVIPPAMHLLEATEVKHRRAAEFRADDHKGILQQPSPLDPGSGRQSADPISVHGLCGPDVLMLVPLVGVPVRADQILDLLLRIGLHIGHKGAPW
jgi:hypothetical protein